MVALKKIRFKIVKASGDTTEFSEEKLRNSLSRSGADKHTVDQIVNTVSNELYAGISTKEIYNRAYAILKKHRPVYASKYKLKNAIYELGPTGYPFEKFIGAILMYSGYEVAVGQIMQGKCVTHEVDVVAHKNGKYIIAECKFHSDSKRNCDVKIPLYIHSRFHDIRNNYTDKTPSENTPNEGWLVTNTRFTSDALQFAECSGLYVLSWDYPKNHSLKDRIDRLGLYPITVTNLLSKREKQFLLDRDVVLCRQLLQQTYQLDHLGLSESRKQRIIKEMKLLSHE